jgi:multiple sugar transport system permease protein
LFILFLIPGLIIFLFVILIPTILAINYSFYQATSFVSEPTYVGIDNYVNLIKDNRFWRDLWQTLIYAGSSVSLQIVIGIVIALILNQNFVGRDLVRGVTVVPYIIPVIVVTIGWEWILDTNWGVINNLIANLGLEKIQFLSIDLAMFTAIMLSVWTWTPFVTLVFLSGLQTIPTELYESAKLDGANSLQQFWRVTLPMVKSIILTIVLLRGLWMFNKFDLIWLLTGGGPLETTETLPILIYLNTFKFFKVGYGSTVAVLSLFIMLLAMIVYLKIFNLEEKDKNQRSSKNITRLYHNKRSSAEQKGEHNNEKNY